MRVNVLVRCGESLEETYAIKAQGAFILLHDLITALFYEVDEQLRTIPKHPEAHLWPSEVVTLGLLHALKGVGNRPFYRWLTRDYRPLFPRVIAS
jgi:hypothetical protein